MSTVKILKLALNCLVIGNLSAYKINPKVIQIPKNKHFYTPGKIDILLGANWF